MKRILLQELLIIVLRIQTTGFLIAAGIAYLLS